MSKVRYTDAPADVAEAMRAAIPVDPHEVFPPEFFARQTEKERITLNIDREAVDQFRAYAKQHGLKYQSMINQVVSAYAKQLQPAK